MKKIEKTPDFIQIPYQLIGDRTLSPIDRLVYGAVYFYSKMSGERCFASNTVIARLLLSTPKTVSRALQKLEDRRYIIRDFSDPSTKVNRTEIIPLVAMGKLYLNKSKTTPNGGVTTQNDSTPNGVPSTPNSVPKYPKRGTGKKAPKSRVLDEDIEDISHIFDTTTPNGGTPNGGEIEKGIENNIENKDKELIILSGLSDDLVPNSDTNPNGKNKDPAVNDAIALFLVAFPGDFIGKRTAFAKPPTREAVEALMGRYTLDQIRELIRKYDAGKTDPYRPQVGTVYEFCSSKLAKVEAYVAKTGGLWAQKSISTPEQRADSDMLIKRKVDAIRERQRLNKEAWELEHPKN